MKNTIFRQLARAVQRPAPELTTPLINTPCKLRTLSGQRGRESRRQANRLNGFLAIAASLLAAEHVMASPSVKTLGGSSPGYLNGDTLDALFNTPMGLALDSTGNFLYLADRDNSAIRLLNLSAGQTFTFATDGISQPVGVAL